MGRLSLRSKQWLEGAAVVILGLILVYFCFLTPQKRAVRSRLNDAEAKCDAAMEKRLKPVSDLFAKGRKGAKGFAEEVLSWNGKWHVIKGVVVEDSHRKYLEHAFAEHIFGSDELRDVLKSAIQYYLDDVEGIENELLVKLRADLEKLEQGSGQIPILIGDDLIFSREYRKLSAKMIGELQLNVGMSVSRELAVIFATDIATHAAVQAAKAVAVELGIDAGLLGTGVASSAMTLGVGLVVMVIVDALIDAVLKMAGYDPVAKIESLVIDSLNAMEAAMLRDPGFFSSDKKGTLRERIEQLNKSRSKLRRETIYRLLSEGGI